LLGDCVRYLAAGTVIIVLGLILGFRPDNGVPGVLAALGLVILFSFSLSWVFTTMGLLMRSPNAVMNAGFMSIFPITFLSNIYVEPETLPKGLEAFVEANPISHLVSASRGLMDGSLDSTNLIVVLATAAALTAVFGPLTSRLYRTRT
jgi:ABC-2 type transport system permease protein